MKNVLVTCFVILFSSTLIHSQEPISFEKDKTTFGVKGGINQSLISADDGSTDLGYFLGLFSETRLSQKWSLQNELIFTANTITTMITLGNSDIEELREFTFFEVPVHLKYYLTDNFSVFAGPKLSFLAAGRANNVGLALDGGIQWDFTKKFFLEARYSQDLFTQNIVPAGNSSVFTKDISLNHLRLGAGLKF